MIDLRHRFVETNGVRMHLAERGEGPLVLFCHGFPETWYAWRHQLLSLAEAGFHAVAPDMRGYGRTDRPADASQYTLLHLVGDMVGVLDALGVDQAVIVGHDWGAPVAWHAALMRPDRFRGVVALSVPYLPRRVARPTTVMPQTPDAVFYQLYFQAPGVAEADLERDVRRSMRALLTSGIGSDAEAGDLGMVRRTGGYVEAMRYPAELPSWLTQADLDVFVAEFERTGFTGGLNWYRSMDLSWDLMGAYAGAPIPKPALFMAGDRDIVARFPAMQRVIENLRQFVPRLQDTIILPGCHHWTQQERAPEVSAAIIDFVRGL